MTGHPAKRDPEAISRFESASKKESLTGFLSRKASWKCPIFCVEAAGGFEPPYNGFAYRRLTTWLSRPGWKGIVDSRSPVVKTDPFLRYFMQRRGLRAARHGRRAPAL